MTMDREADGTMMRDEPMDAADIGTPNGGNEPTGPLLDERELEAYRMRWNAAQVRFVDDPRGTVGEADELVSDLMTRLTQSFADQRAELESQWERGGDASTEDLRVAMRRYRSLFIRLLAA